MDKIIQKWRSSSSDQFEENLRFLKSLKDDTEWDKRAERIDKEVFSKIDCLECANCCKTTPALLEKKDIKRIAKHLTIPPKTFIRKYLIEDISGEYMIARVPCTFLNEDNTCQIYDVRPKACRQYPHTAQAGFHKRAKMNAKNTLVCPATFEIINQLKNL